MFSFALHWLASETPYIAVPPKHVSQNEDPGPSFAGLYDQYESAFFAVGLTFLTQLL